ncbi:MAG TPA: type II secretion system protein [Firmicutes bacterium]|jgi:prepilin-type N-terminal cleavage/methylation domain-containing protein|nr:MAG: hypothetical protein AA931_03775 [Peptococcaceae bacterium 1109]HHT74324.1 type II secretion system protein [Bacillota bacterium]
MINNLPDDRGFTLIEVLVAIVIITTLVGSFGPLIASSVRSIQWAGSRLKTLYAIRGKMEERVARLEGSKVPVTVRGPSESSGRREWVIEGVMITLEAEEPSGKVILTSFAVGSE